MDGEQKIRKAYESILDHDFEQAIEWFEAAVEQEPHNAGFHFKLSITYARSGKLAKALEHACHACDLDQSSQEYRYHMHNLQAMKCVQLAEKTMEQPDGDTDMAIIYLNQAVALDPLCLEAYLLLGVVYAERHDYHKALDSLREALKLDPNHGTAAQLILDYEKQLKQK